MSAFGVYMKLFLSLAAAMSASELTWYTYTGNKKTRKNKHRTHDLVLEPGERIGIARKRSGNTALYKQTQPTVEYLLGAGDEAWLKTVMKTTKPAKNVKFKAGASKRIHSNVRANARNFTDRLSESPFMPRVRDEANKIDRKNYQWRKLTTKAQQILSKSGEALAMLRPKDVFGWRIKGSGKEVYILLTNDRRIRLPNKVGVALFEASTILPKAKQLTGIIDVKATALDEAKQKKQHSDAQRKANEKADEHTTTHKARRVGHVRVKHDVDFEDGSDESEDGSADISDLPEEAEIGFGVNRRRKRISRTTKVADPVTPSKPKVSVPEVEVGVPFTEQDIITFEKDPEEIDWFVLAIHEDRNIVSAELYNITDQPDFIQKVRFSPIQQQAGKWRNVVVVRKAKAREIKNSQKFSMLEYSDEKVVA